MEKTRILPNITFSSIFSSVVGVALLGAVWFYGTIWPRLAQQETEQSRFGFLALLP
jgi:hypothetical protein